MRQKITVRGYEVAFDRECECKNPKQTLVFLHGWGGSSQSWDVNIQDLKKDFDCIALDIPGFGVSFQPDNIWDLNDFTDFLRRFVQTLRVDKFTLIGKSFGGRIAILYASLFPEDLSGLVLVSAAGIEDKNPITKAKITISKVGLKVLTLLNQKKVESLRVKYYKLVGIKPDKNDYKWQVKKLVTSQNLEGEATKIKVPSLIVWGKNDKILPLRIGKKLNKTIKNSSFIEISGGHSAHRESSQKFNEIIREYLYHQYKQRF